MLRQMCLLVLLLVSATVDAQDWTWVKKIGLNGSGNDVSSDICINNNKDVVVAGLVKNQSTFGTGSNSVTPPIFGDHDIFLCTYDSLGTLKWAKRFGSNQSDWASDVIVDSLNNIYVVGLFDAVCNFGDTIMSPTASVRSSFIGKYSEDGNRIWLKSIGDDYASVTSIIWDKGTPNIYLTGVFEGSLNLDVDTIYSNGDKDMFLAKMDTAGNFIWAKSWGGTNLDGAAELVVGPDHNIYFVGSFRNSVYFDSQLISSAGGRDIFIAKADSMGNIIWVKPYGGFYDDIGRCLDISTDGSLYLSGTFSDFVDFTPDSTFQSHGDLDVFLMKFDSSGNQKWVRQYGGDDFDQSWDITVDPRGDIYLGFNFSDSVYFENQTILSEGDHDMMIALMDSAGNNIWYKQIKGNYYQGKDPSVRRIIVEDHLYVTGGFLDTVDFDTINMIASGWSRDVYTGQMRQLLRSGLNSDANTICEGEQIQFFEDVIGMTNLVYHWSFPGGVPSTSSSANPIVSYSSAGNYDVQLVVEDRYGNDTLNLTAYISVGQPPLVDLGQDTLLCDTSDYVLSVPDGYASYNWSTGSMDTSVTISTSQTVSVSVLDVFGCANVDTVQVDFYDCIGIGIDEISEEISVDLFPNPANDYLVVTNSINSLNGTLYIHDIKGRLVLKQSVNNGENQYLDLTDIDPGLYILSIVDADSKVAFKKFVKQ